MLLMPAKTSHKKGLKVFLPTVGMPPEKWAAAVPIGAIVVSRSSSSGRAVPRDILVPRDICLPDSTIVPVLVVVSEKRSKVEVVSAISPKLS